MKEIKTASYTKKEAGSQSGEAELTVNWSEFAQWFEEAGESLPDALKNRVQPTRVLIEYNYDYDSFNKQPVNIRGNRLLDYESGQYIDDSYIVSSFIDYYDNDIKADIEQQRIAIP